MEDADLLNLLPGILIQARSALANLRLAETRLISVEEREKDPEKDRQAAILDQNYYRLLRLVNNLTQALSLAKEQPPTLRDYDLVQLVGKLCEEAASLGEQMGLTLRFLCSRERLICSVGRDALETILFHLLSNAFRFSPRGGVVTVELRQSGRRVLLSVQDSGPGISPEQREGLLLFRQEGDGRSPLLGSGLGLPLCSQLAQRQGGVLVVESPPDKGGSRVTLSLPLRTTGEISEPRWDFSGGVNRALVDLADVLPAKAYLVRYQEDF